MKIEGLPVIDVDESEKITVAVRADDLLEGDTANPDQHPIAIALRRTADTSEPTSLEGSSMSAAAKATEVRHPATRMYSSRLPPSEKLTPDEAQAALDALAAHKAEATELLKLRRALAKVEGWCGEVR
jgi:hypothetical protein